MRIGDAKRRARAASWDKSSGRERSRDGSGRRQKVGEEMLRARVLMGGVDSEGTPASLTVPEDWHWQKSVSGRARGRCWQRKSRRTQQAVPRISLVTKWQEGVVQRRK
jgi:hypothetical protein